MQMTCQLSGTEPSFRENPSEIILLHSRVRNSKEFRLLPQESYVVYRVWKFSLLQKGNQTRKNKKRNKYKRIYNSIVTSNCICITFIHLVRKPCNQRPETTHIEPNVQESQGYSTKGHKWKTTPMGNLATNTLPWLLRTAPVRSIILQVSRLDVLKSAFL